MQAHFQNISICQCQHWNLDSLIHRDNGKFKHDVLRQRQTAKMCSDFAHFSSIKSLKGRKISLIHNANILTLVNKRLKGDGNEFSFTFSRLP